MIRPLFTAGRYLAARRAAAGLSVADVAALVFTDPATPEHERKLHLELIEADAQPMTLSTVMALRAVFHFDLLVLGRLEALAQGQDLAEPHLCRICGWGTVWDQLKWPIQRLCHSCHNAVPPEDRAAWVADYQAGRPVAGPTVA